MSADGTVASVGEVASLRGDLRLVADMIASGSRVLRGADFTPETVSAALFVPPTASRMMLRSATAIERVGERWFTTFAGVAVVEATKQIYAKPALKRKDSRRRVYVPVAHGAPRLSGR